MCCVRCSHVYGYWTRAGLSNVAVLVRQSLETEEAPTARRLSGASKSLLSIPSRGSRFFRLDQRPAANTFPVRRLLAPPHAQKLSSLSTSVSTSSTPKKRLSPTETSRISACSASACGCPCLPCQISASRSTWLRPEAHQPLFGPVQTEPNGSAIREGCAPSAVRNNWS